MNESEARELVEKIMHADSVVHLQQLNIPWRPPTQEVFSFLADKAEGAGAGDGSTIKGADSATHNNSTMMEQSATQN